ncbi:MAG: CaiB/BaiF CoA transferase family protein [Alphaproteobacteria bacterium]
MPTPMPLEGLRILDLATVIAGPLSSALLADFGADVVKIELPNGGDGVRALPPFKNGVALWGKVTNRNKRGITLDIRTPEGLDILKRMLPKFDVLVENFRPSTLAKWGLPIEEIRRINPDLTVLRVSGFGQTGPRARDAGFARVAEAMSGLTTLCGESDRTPLHLGYPIADGITGVFGAFSIMMALYRRLNDPAARGEEIDLSLYESMHRILEFLVIEYDQLGAVRERSGNRSQYAVPSGVYRTDDDRWVSLACSTQSVFERMAEAMDRADLIDDARFRTNADRVTNADAIEEIVTTWFGANEFPNVSQLLSEKGVAFSLVFTAKDAFEDPHYAARENIVALEDSELGTIRMQGIVPKLRDAPGAVRRAGPALGQHNAEVYEELLELSADEISALKEKGIV